MRGEQQPKASKQIFRVIRRPAATLQLGDRCALLGHAEFAAGNLPLGFRQSLRKRGTIQ